MNLKLITYINLDFRKDKFININEQIKDSKIESFKTNGVICNNYTLYNTIPEIKNNPLRHKGTIGCFLAHQLAIKNLIDKSKNIQDCNDNYCLVLEDDVEIKTGFWGSY